MLSLLIYICVDIGGQPGHVPPIIEKRPCIYHYLPPSRNPPPNILVCPPNIQCTQVLIYRPTCIFCVCQFHTLFGLLCLWPLHSRFDIWLEIHIIHIVAYIRTGGAGQLWLLMCQCFGCHG